MKPQPLPWCEPLALARALNAPSMVLLHSSAATHYSGDTSLLAVDCLESVDIERFSDIDALLSQQKSRWFGFLGYELKHDCERYSTAEKGEFALPRGRMMRFGAVYEFNHKLRTLVCCSDDVVALPALHDASEIAPAAVKSLTSNMSKQEYLGKVKQVLSAIAEGDIYQANLTRKFYGTWQDESDTLSLFARMCRLTPAPYSALIRMNGVDILSSSPELFLRCDTDGVVETRPIKGSIARGETVVEDEANRIALEQSSKNRAENLMIVDLMRNDLARACTQGSVKVSKLFDVNTHATIHHMASSITGQLRDDCSKAALIRDCFPPGSMTGAPKIRAVELCNQLETLERGVYSGALGWLDSDGSMELSVVIRTLIIKGTQFEFQVGGGIVADSEPLAEWAETMEKSLGLINTLGVSRGQLESL